MHNPTYKGIWMSHLIAICLFSLTMSITPGPVNIVAFSTSANHGFKRALPFVSGATIAFTLLLAALGAGVASFLSQHTEVLEFLGYGGSVFLCYMGYQIAISGAELSKDQRPPATFSDGTFLQLLNPKAWAACLAGITGFKLGGDTDLLIKFVSIYFVICYLAIALWALIGSHAKVLLRTPKQLQILNIAMGGSLVLLALYMQI